MKQPTILPEPWCSMTEEQAGAMNEEQARRMLGSLNAPRLNAFRAAVASMRTSEIILYISSPNTLEKKILTDEDLDKYNAADEQLMMASAILALGDEIDRRVPRP